MDTNTPEDRNIAGLAEYLAVIRRRRWLVLSVTALVFGASLFFSYRKTPIYAATARVLVRATSADPTAYFSINLETERGLAQSAAVADVVAQNSPGGATATSLLQGLTVRVEPSTEILEIIYASPDPQQAQALANEFADSYLEFRRKEALAQYTLQTSTLKDRIADLNERKQELTRKLSKTKNPVRLTTLGGELTQLNTQIGLIQNDIARLGTTETLEKSGGDVVQPAVTPAAPSSPNHLQDAIIALLAGLALGCGVAFARERFDTRLHGAADLEAKLRAPVLATIPRVDAWRKRERTELIAQTDSKSPASEAYRALRTNLQFISRRDGVRLIAITSPFMGEGKTTTVANLAVVLSQAGKRVIAVSCDLRRPRLHRFFGCTNDRGVTNILLGQAATHDVAQRAPGLEHVRVIASGPVPPNPAELLASEKMDQLLASLRGAADYVLLDLPPLLAVADGLILGPKSDGVLVVVDATATARASAESVRMQMEQVGGTIIGGVFNNFDPNLTKAYSSDYRSHYPYAYGGYALSDDTLGNDESTDLAHEPTIPLVAEELWTSNGDGDSSALEHADDADDAEATREPLPDP